MPDDSISHADWTLVQKHLLGALPPDEADVARALIRREPRLRALVDVLQTTSMVAESPSVDLGSLKRRIDAARADVPLSPVLQGIAGVRGDHRLPGIFKAQPLRRPLVSIVTAFVLGIVVTALGWTASVHHGARSSTRSSLTYSTGKGERAKITLPDGGTVALNVASRLDVPTDYLAGNHTVRLVGEGLFDVVHHSGAPLTVLAGPAAVRVLGTSFLVRKYATDSMATVAVRDGKVAVRSIVLTAAQQVAVGRTGVGRVRPADLTQFDFTLGVLNIDNVLFPEAIAELDRWYDADIRLGDPRLATLRMAGQFGAGSLAELSEYLVHTYEVSAVRNGRVLTLYPRR